METGEGSNGTSHTFTVQAVSDHGTGLASDPAVSATPVAPPVEPTGLSAVSGNMQVELSWDDPGNSNAAVASYELKIGSGDYTVITPSDVLDAEDNATGRISHTATNLQNGREYRFTVRAVNASGSAESAITRASGAPTGLTASAVEGTGNENKVKLTWTLPGGHVASLIQSYSILYSGEGLGATHSISNVSRSTTSYEVGSLVEGIVYSFGVEAVYSSTRAVYAIIKAVPGAPAAPENLRAETAGAGEVTLTWDDPENAAIIYYQLSIDDGAWEDIADSDATTTSYTATGLMSGTSHSFKVRAVSGDSEDGDKTDDILGQESGSVSATPN